MAQKEQQLTSLGTLRLQEQLGALEEQRADFEREKAELKAQGLEDDLFDEKYRALMIRQENEAREREIVRSNAWKER